MESLTERRRKPCLNIGRQAVHLAWVKVIVSARSLGYLGYAGAAGVSVNKGEIMVKHRRTGKNQNVVIRFRRNVASAMAIALTLSFLAAGAALAGWTGFGSPGQKHSNSKGAEVSIDSLSAGSPSKELIYAGSNGRLIATEEQACSYSIAPASSFYTSAGGQGSVNVTAQTGCNWTVVNVPSWITLTSADTGSGNGVVTFEVRENFTGSARQGIFTIAGLNFTVVQDGGFANCAAEISPTSGVFSLSGGTGSITVTIDSHCGWQAVSNASWITVTSGNVGIGNGTVTYSVASSGSARNGTMTIAGVTFNVKQK